MSFAFDQHNKWRKLEPFLLGLDAHLQEEMSKIEESFDVIGRYLSKWKGRWVISVVCKTGEAFPLPEYPRILEETYAALKEAGYLRQADELMNIFNNDRPREYNTLQHVRLLLMDLTP